MANNRLRQSLEAGSRLSLAVSKKRETWICRCTKTHLQGGSADIGHTRDMEIHLSMLTRWWSSRLANVIYCLLILDDFNPSISSALEKDQSFLVGLTFDLINFPNRAIFLYRKAKCVTIGFFCFFFQVLSLCRGF